MCRKQSRPAVVARLCAAGLLLAGCSGQMPKVVLDTPMGATPIDAPPPPGMPLGQVGPPPGLDNPLPGAGSPPQATGGDRSGNYAGTAVPLETGGGICIDTKQVTNFRVRGNRVSFGRFRGTIAPDGGLQMPDGQDWIVGQFEGATFHGQLNLYGRLGSPSCTYMFSLERVAS
jgi:hypothetical protein